VGVCVTLLAAMDVDSLLWLAKVIPAVVVGLGFVIFVHELGHFAVAKACGVKCPKFYLGFDVPLGEMINSRFGRTGNRVLGIPIPRTIGKPIKIGETEYGIGILPLGGYVRMLGQDDDPANIEQQLKESQVSGNTPDAKEIVGPDGKTYLIDPRSYMAKSVPQRMAIISAGVVMNVIFAFIFAVIAYKLGVPYNPAIVSRTAPGTPAWQADVRPGDVVAEVAGIKDPSFEDLSGSVMLGDMEGGVPFVIQRGSEKISLTLHPKQGKGLPRVGIAPGASLRVPIEKDEKFLKALREVDATPNLKIGDEVLEVDGQKVADYAALSALFARYPEKTFELTVRSGGYPPKDDPFGPLEGGEMVKITLKPRPTKTLGIVMNLGTVSAVQENSPAAGKLKAGDFIERIAPTGGSQADAFELDPMTLPDDLRRLAEESGEVELTVKPAASSESGRQESLSVVIPLRQVQWLEGSLAPLENEPVVATALGVAYNVLSVVDRVTPDGPAAKAGLQSGDVVTKAEFVYPEGYDEDKDGKKLDPLTFSSELSDRKANWPALMATIQELPDDVQVKLTYKRDDKLQDVTLTPVASDGYFLAERHIPFALVERNRIAATWDEAASRGWDQTVSSLGMVYRFLSKLGSQVSVTTLGGPITIAKAAGMSASEGPGRFLLFLTMLSANLAVINFLPIPLLDGGHMVFLAWEGIRGKPAGEKFVATMHMAGFAFIISLMLFVLSLDLGLIPRNL
jgi:regulator of sigma E protease